MFCLAGVGGRVADIMERTASASAILAIDGCSLEGAHQCLRQAGFEGFTHLRIDEMGMEKGKTPPSQESIRQVVIEGAQPLT